MRGSVPWRTVALNVRASAGSAGAPDPPSELAVDAAGLIRHDVTDRIYPGAVWAIGDGQDTYLTGAAGLLDPSGPPSR
jgi:hypothetical protein